MNPNISAALILAAAIIFYALAGRYELITTSKVHVYRIDQLTGVVSLCLRRECTQLLEAGETVKP